MKSVLISIQPKWCELIANGKKTIEVRKTRPKIETPFKVYIYCTNSQRQYLRKIEIPYQVFLTENKDILGKTEKVKQILGDVTTFAVGGGYNGKVIGEFVCDEIYDIGYSPYNHGGFISDTDNLYEKSCLDLEQMFNYLSQGYGYGWHISDLVIYDKPKELSEFSVLDDKAIKDCKHRERIYVNPDSVNGAWLKGSYICTKGEEDWCNKCKTKPLKRPPQSWCYVEEVAPTKIEHSSLCETDTYEVKE